MKKPVEIFILNNFLVLGLFCSCMPLVLANCSGSDSHPPNNANNSKAESLKEQKIQEFNTEINELIDSSEYYFDWGLNSLDNGMDKSEISSNISPSLKRLEMKIDKLSKGFHQVAVEIRLSDEENKKVFENLNKKFQPLFEKRQRLIEAGVSLN